MPQKSGRTENSRYVVPCTTWNTAYFSKWTLWTPEVRIAYINFYGYQNGYLGGECPRYARYSTLSTLRTPGTVEYWVFVGCRYPGYPAILGTFDRQHRAQLRNCVFPVVDILGDPRVVSTPNTRVVQTVPSDGREYNRGHRINVPDME